MPRMFTDDDLDVMQRVRTSPGARTGLFVPALQTLFVAIPARGRTAAQIQLYRVR